MAETASTTAEGSTAPPTTTAPTGERPADAEPRPTKPPDHDDWREAARTWESRAKEDAAKAARAEAELAALREKSQTAEEKALNDAKAEGRREVEEAVNARLIRAEVKRAATGVLADPADAIAFLDLSSFKVDEHGDVSEADIKKALDKLVEDKPHLAAKGTKGADLHQGARGVTTEVDPNQWVRGLTRS